jgi:hypothetical protein
MLLDAEYYQWAEEHVTVIKLVCWWREHSALLFDLMDVYEYDGLMYFRNKLK